MADFWRDEYDQTLPVPKRVLGYPLIITYDCPPDKLYFYDGGFHAHPGAVIPYNDFWKLYSHLKTLNLLPKEESMSRQLIDFDESEHDRTGGPTWQEGRESCRTAAWRGDEPPPESDFYGTPLQEQVEQVEEALSKAIDVIEALVNREIELRNDVYQAQVDAQDWQNKYNEMKRGRDLDNGLVGQRNVLDMQARIEELTDENTQLELRNERQAKRLGRILATVQGQHEDKRI